MNEEGEDSEEENRAEEPGDRSIFVLETCLALGLEALWFEIRFSGHKQRRIGCRDRAGEGGQRI
jgi:hypothetical protein